MGRAVLFFLALVGIGACSRDIPSKEAIDKHFEKQEYLLNKIINSGKLFHTETINLETVDEHTFFNKRIIDNIHNKKICDPGYTGLDCEPICNEPKTVLSHDGISDFGETIDFTVSPGCQGAVRLPLDEHTRDLYISLASESEVSPQISIMTFTGAEVLPTTIVQSTSRHYLALFKDITVDFGEGNYLVQISSIGSDETSCIYTASSPTELVFDGGFITDRSDDFVQETIPTAHDGIGRFPIANVSSFFAFKVPGVLSFPAHPTEVVVLSTEAADQWANVTNRYKCSASAIAGPYTCSKIGAVYYVKIIGLDSRGNQFQRIYFFDCEAGWIVTTTKPPRPDQCFNDGILVNNGQECYCGPYYEGRQCEVRRCFNDGSLASNGECICRIGYSGPNCQDVVCPSRSGAQFDLSSRALTFIIRSGTSMAAHMPKILDAAQRIISFYEINHSEYLQKFVLAVVSNGQLPLLAEYDKGSEFIDAILNIKNNVDLTCDDILLTGLSAVLDSPALSTYRQSPVFIFSDGLSNDDVSARNRLLHQLSFWRGQVFFMLTDSITGQCNIDVASPGYRNLLILAQFTQGLVSHVSLDELGNAALHIARSIYRVNYLLSNDLLDSCARAPEFQNFFVDDSIQYFYVIATGTGLSLFLTRPDRVIFQVEPDYVGSDNTYIWIISDFIQTGTYMLRIGSTGKHPCQYRVLGRGTSDLFLGVSSTVNEDALLQQPTFNQSSHIVAHINNVQLPDAGSLHAEAVIWTNEGESDKRVVLYASNGIYRDNCDFFLYFGAWTCKQAEQFFYVNVFMTNSIGLTMQRTTTGFCSTIPPTSIPPEGCLNGGIGYNGTCICQPHYTGEKCENIQCMNMGTPLVTSCGCVAGFTGQFCETTGCYQHNENAPFSANGRSLTLLLHDTISTRSAIRSIRDSTPRVIQDISHHHAEWITHYQVVRFNDTSYSMETDSSSSDDFLQGINKVYTHNIENSEVSCRNVSFFPALYAAITDVHVTKYGIVFAFINGYVVMDTRLLSNVFDALEKSHVQVNVVMLSSAPCGRPLSDTINQLLMNLAAFTGGEYIMVMPSNAGAVLRSIPTFYRVSYVYEDYASNCSQKQSFYFPVDSQLQSFTAYVVGELDGSPVYSAPDGSKLAPYTIFGDIGLGSRLDQVIKPCDDGWESYDNQCWKYGLVARDWFTARDECHSSGAVLATIFNAAEQAFIDQQVSNINYWTGLNNVANIGSFVWDQPTNQSLSLESTGYKNWASGQPAADDLKRCVFDSHKTNPGWTVQDCNTAYPYICMKHAYNADFEPDSETVDILPRGIWKMDVKTLEGACSVQIFAQSGIQLFSEYVTNIHYDSGSPEPYVSAEDNRIIAHATNQQLLGQGIEGNLQYAHMYTMNLTIIQAQHFQRRDSEECAYEYISTPFKCPGYTFQKLSTGIDRFGYLYQRIEPVTCLAGPVDPNDCRNGAVYFGGKCVCPPRYQGDFCEEPMCVNGRLSAAGTSCSCLFNYLGLTCETPICTRPGNISDPSLGNKTFVLLLDGSNTGNMADILSNLDNVLGTVFTMTNAHTGWFKNYIGVVFRDSDAGDKSLSDVIESTDPSQFTSLLKAELSANPYQSKKQSRSVVAAVVRALESDNVQPRSLVFIVTSGNADDYTYETLAFNAVARKHAFVNFLIVGDEGAPGGVDYTDDSINTYFSLAYSTGGAYYQTAPGFDQMKVFWANLMDSLYGTYHISTAQRRNFTGITEYIQVGAGTSTIILDVFSDTNPKLTLLDADGNSVHVNQKVTSKTNIIFTGQVGSSGVGEPGLWTVKLEPQNTDISAAVGYIGARGSSDVRINLAFNHDLRQDGGIHSDAAEYYPIVGENANAVVVDASDGILTFVQAFSSDERRLLWASPLLKREGCTYTYISTTLFTCMEASVAIAIDGEDFEGHPIRRMSHVHCVGNFIPENTTTTPRTTLITTTGPSTTPLPSCDPDDPKVDVVIVFDASLGIPPAEYEEILTTMMQIPDLVTVDQTHSRFMLGTYWDHVEFPLTPDFTKIQNRENFTQILTSLVKYGYSGEMGNNIQSIFDAIDPNAFRSDSVSTIILFSSMGWDKSNTGISFPDPTESAQKFHGAGVNIVPIGYGPDANFTQLTAIGGSCVHMVKNKQELEAVLPWILTLFCRTEQYC